MSDRIAELCIAAHGATSLDRAILTHRSPGLAGVLVLGCASVGDDTLPAPHRSAAQGRRGDPRGSLDLGHEHRGPVDVAPRPLLARLERPDERVSFRVCVGCCVTVRRVVAATDVPALEADPQMEPRVPRDETLLTSIDAFREDRELDVIKVRARHRRTASPPRPDAT